MYRSENGTEWLYTLTLNSPTPTENDAFGSSISAWGSNVAIGIAFSDSVITDGGNASFLLMYDYNTHK